MSELLTVIHEENGFLRADVSSGAIGVDLENGVLRGRIVAQEGQFKDGRGQFTGESLRRIVKLMREQPDGLKARFGHPTTGNDGPDTFLGRDKNPRMDTIQVKQPDGSTRDVRVVRSDLHFDPTALKPGPKGGAALGTYVMERAQNDHKSFGSSLHLAHETKMATDENGRALRDKNGNPQPAVWLPTSLKALDVVDDPAACGSMLGVDESQAKEFADALDKTLANVPREVAEARLQSLSAGYLDARYGATETFEKPPKEEPKAEPKPTDKSDYFKRRLANAVAGG